jgi:hypothetical protein
MTTDPLYDEVSPALRKMNEQELAAEERAAFQALTSLALRHIDQPSYEDAESLSAESRLLEVQLALNLKVRDATVAIVMEQEAARTGKPIAPQSESLIRSVVHDGFGRDIDRIAEQLAICREKIKD